MKFDMGRFRSALRKARKGGVGARTTLADAADLHATTIQNAEMGPDIPGIDTVAKLIYGSGLTMGQFFSQLEEDNDSVTHATRPVIKGRGDGGSAVPNPQPESDHGLRHRVSGAQTAILITVLNGVATCCLNAAAELQGLDGDAGTASQPAPKPLRPTTQGRRKHAG